MSDLVELLLKSRTQPIVFHNSPREGVTRDQYESLIQTAAREFLAQPGTLTVCQYGGVNNPGISDIDLMVVVDSSVKTDIAKFTIAKFDSFSRYLMKHPALVINEKLVEQFTNWDIYGPKFIAGDPQWVPSVPPHPGPHISTELVLDRTFLIYPRHLLKIWLSKAIDIRDALTSLYSFKYVIDLANRAGVPGNASDDIFERDATELKNNWYNIAPVERERMLADLIPRGISAGYDLIARLNTHVGNDGSKNSTIASFNTLHIFADFDYLTVFRKNWEPKESLESTIEIFNKYSIVFMSLPEIYARRIALSASIAGRYGNFLSGRMKTSYPIDTGSIGRSLSETIVARASFVDEHLNWLEENNYVHGSSLSANDNALSGGWRGLVRRIVKQHIIGSLITQSEICGNNRVWLRRTAGISLRMTMKLMEFRPRLTPG